MKKKKMSIKKIERRLNNALTAACALLFLIDSMAIGSIIYKSRKDKQEHYKTLSNICYSGSYSKEELYDLLLDAINNNINLSDEEKALIINNLWIFVDNKDYLDIFYLQEVFENLDIIYSSKRKNNKAINTIGDYNSKTGIITFYKVHDLDDVNVDIFTHELFHSMQKVNYSNYNSYLIETINTIFNEDYTDVKEGALYSNYYNFTKMLIEIIGIEPIRKFQCYTQIEYITDALTSIFGSSKDAYDLLYYLDEYKKTYENVISKESVYNEKKLKSLEKVIVDRLAIYYKNKFGIEMENDLIMLYYYDYPKFCSIISNKFFINDSDTHINEENNVHYFYNTYENKLIIYANGEMSIKKIIIDNNGLAKKYDYIENKSIFYVIDNSNRYINCDKSLVLHKK